MTEKLDNISPTPWSIDKECEHVIDWGGDHIAEINNLANAHLISAAPDLYRSLWDITSLLMTVTHDPTGIVGKHVKAAQWAIKKARGEE